MHEFIIFTIGGLAAAGIYAITASGLTLTYTTTGIFNWAHGAIGMVCAFAYWQLSIGWGWPTLVSMLVCLFVVAPVIGIVIEAGVMRRLEGVSEASKLVVTLAVALMLLGVAQWIWNPTTYRALPPLFNNDTLVLGSIRISYNDVTVLILALVVAVGLRLFLYRTRMGVPCGPVSTTGRSPRSTGRARLPTPAMPGSSDPYWPHWRGSSSHPP